jgi:PncC family amidohydrolase
VSSNVSLDIALNRISSDVCHALRSMNFYLATIESCTGGCIANEITNISGSSSVLLQSFIVYSDSAKIKLGVSEALIREYTSYSPQVAQAMVESAQSTRNLMTPLEKTYIIGVTGIIEKRGSGMSSDAPYDVRADVCIGLGCEYTALRYEETFESRELGKKHLTLAALEGLMGRFN